MNRSTLTSLIDEFRAEINSLHIQEEYLNEKIREKIVIYIKQELSKYKLHNHKIFISNNWYDDCCEIELWIENKIGSVYNVCGYEYESEKTTNNPLIKCLLELEDIIQCLDAKYIKHDIIILDKRI